MSDVYDRRADVIAAYGDAAAAAERGNVERYRARQARFAVALDALIVAVALDERRRYHKERADMTCEHGGRWGDCGLCCDMGNHP